MKRLALLITLAAAPLAAQTPKLDAYLFPGFGHVSANQPNFGSYQRDKAAFADPSLPYSVLAVRARIESKRTPSGPTSTPGLPDPFELRQTIQLARPLPELTDVPLYLNPPTGK